MLKLPLFMKIFPKVLILSLLLSVLLASPCLSQGITEEAKTGSLNVYSKIGFLKVYVDNDFVGETPVEIEHIMVGTHLVTATKNDETVYEEIAKIDEGEVNTILISEEKKKSAPPAGEGAKKSDDKTEKQKLGSSSFLNAVYGKIGYISSDNFKYPSIADEHYASSLLYGVGYKLYLAPNVGVLLDYSRADFADPDTAWYIAPFTVNLQLGYPIAPGSTGQYYYQLGIGYYTTNLKSDSGNYLSCIGYNLATGLEFPVGDAGSVFLETSYGIAENSKEQFAMYSLILAIGYRMNVQ